MRISKYKNTIQLAFIPCAWRGNGVYLQKKSLITFYMSMRNNK